MSIVADELSSDTEYVFACYASSVVGNGAQSKQIRVRTSESLYVNVQLYIYNVIKYYITVTNEP